MDPSRPYYLGNVDYDESDPRTKAVVKKVTETGVAIPEEITLLPKGSRVGRAQRESVIDHLNQMVSEEYITPDEHAARVQHAASAPTHEHLNILTSDLPPKPLSKWTSMMAAQSARKAASASGKARIWRRLALSWTASVVYVLTGITVDGALSGTTHGGISAAGAMGMAAIAVTALVWVVLNIVWTVKAAGWS